MTHAGMKKARKPSKPKQIEGIEFDFVHQGEGGPLRLYIDTSFNGHMLTITGARKLLDWLPSAIAYLESQKKGKR